MIKLIKFSMALFFLTNCRIPPKEKFGIPHLKMLALDFQTNKLIMMSHLIFPKFLIMTTQANCLTQPFSKKMTKNKIL